MATPSPTKNTRGRSVAQYEITSTGGVGRKVAEYATITAASKASKISYHIIRTILDGKTPKPGQYHWKELEPRLNITPLSPMTSVLREPPPLPNRSPHSLSLMMSNNHMTGNLDVMRPHLTNSTTGNVPCTSSVLPIDTIHNSNITPHLISQSLGSNIKPKKKQAIPSLMRTAVWNRWIGIEKGQIRCPYCQINNITPFFFECGHVLAEAKGGEVSVENLRPICRECNGKMGTQPIHLDKYRLGPGIAGRLNPKTQEAYPSTVDGRRAFIEAHTLTNLRGDIGKDLVVLTYTEAEALARDRWQNWVEVYEMSQPQPVLVTEKAMRLHPYSDGLYTAMVCDSSRSSLSRALRKLAL